MGSNLPRYLVVAYPKLAKSDFDWIQAIRREHDDLSYRAILPHFTLFFPTHEFTAKTISEAVRTAISGIRMFRFSLRSALLMPPLDGGEYSYIFLVPDEGFSQFIRLNSLIYSRNLKAAQRNDLPFVPHLTVASSKNLLHCRGLSDEINNGRPEISGLIDSLEIAVEDGDKISTVEKIRLDPQ